MAASKEVALQRADAVTQLVGNGADVLAANAAAKRQHPLPEAGPRVHGQVTTFNRQAMIQKQQTLIVYAAPAALDHFVLERREHDRAFGFVWHGGACADANSDSTMGLQQHDQLLHINAERMLFKTALLATTAKADLVLGARVEVRIFRPSPAQAEIQALFSEAHPGSAFILILFFRLYISYVFFFFFFRLFFSPSGRR